MEIQTIQSAMAGVKRIDAFLAQPEREMLAEEGASIPRGDVVVSHVTFGYDERTVLRDLSFTVKSGEQVTLVGRTGAGKSTVFKLLMGLYQPKAGTITIGGVDVSQITDRQRRGCIGCVEQHFARVPGTVLDQITLGDPRISREMAQNAARLAGLDAAIDALPAAYDTPCSDGLFSQGEWQLLCIARAAAADPPCFCLTRSRRTLTRKRKRGCWRHSAARPSGGRCSPFLIASMKNLAAGSSRSKRWTRENKEKRLLSLKT